jgi:hypothetical protein
MGLAAVAVLAISAEEVSTRIYRRRAERLLYDLRQLQVGKSTFEDARAVIMRHAGGVSPFDHSGCGPAHCTFVVGVEHFPFRMEAWGRHLNIEAEYYALRALPPLGLQDWESGGDVRIDGGIVTHIGYRVVVRGSGGWVLGYFAVEDRAAARHLPDLMVERPYFVHWFNITTVGGGEGIESSLTPQASTEERNRAYNFNFDCLTRRGGCTSLCQIAPLAFADYVKETGGMPWLDEHDPNCAKFKQPAANPDHAAHP